MESRENRSPSSDMDRDESESSFNEDKRSGSQDWSDQGSNIERDSDLGSSKGFGESGNVNRGSSDIEE